MNNIVKFDPFVEIQSLQKQFFGDDWSTNVNSQMPTADMYTKDDKELIIEAHLPNFDEKDISVQILDDGSIEIQAEKHEKQEDKSKKYVIRESSSSFYRIIRMPQTVDTSKIEAQMKDDILTIKAPLKKQTGAKRLNIKMK